jgi:glucokinase
LPRKAAKGRGYLGIDIGGTKSLYALFDESFEVLAEKKLRTHPDKGGAAAFSRALAGAIKSMQSQARRHKLEIKRVGVGCAGDIDLKRGVVRASPNLAFLDGYPLRERLEKLTGARVFVGHDVQAGLYGEFRLGAARKARHVIGVWLGTGVGGAVIIGRRLHLGATGHAGDIGNYLLHAVDVSHESPRKEVLDHVASRTAIAGVAATLAAKHRAPQLRKGAGTDVTDIKAGDLADAIKRGDKAVERLVRSRAGVVGAALSNLVDFLNPDLIVLGGGLVEAMPAIMRREVSKAIASHASPKAAKAVKVVVSRLGNHAGTLGAARLAVDMFSGDPPIDLDAL